MKSRSFRLLTLLLIFFSNFGFAQTCANLFFDNISLNLSETQDKWPEEFLQSTYEFTMRAIESKARRITNNPVDQEQIQQFLADDILPQLAQMSIGVHPVFKEGDPKSFISYLIRLRAIDATRFLFGRGKSKPRLQTFHEEVGSIDRQTIVGIPSAIIINEILESINDPVDRDIVKYRANGYTNREISKILETTWTNIQSRWTRIKPYVQQLLEQ